MLQKKNINRRQFLKKAAAVAAGTAVFPYFVPASALGRTGTVAPSNRITLGCIGTGNQGVQDMRGFLRIDDVQVLAVCDVNTASYGYRSAKQYLGREPGRKIVNDYYAAKTRSGRYKGCDAYNDFREIINRDDIDAVLIVTPDHWHALMTIMAARAGKDIYCEKPLSLTVAGGRAMVQAVRKYGVILQTGTHHRSTQQVRFACELVRNGRIGRLKRIIVNLDRHPVRFPIESWQPMPVPDGFDYDMWLGPAPWAPYHKYRCLYTFRFGRDYSGGETTNTGAHCFDIAQWANGTDRTGPVEFEDLGSEFPKKGALFNTVSKVHFRARYANGVELLCTPNPRREAARFEGTEGWIDAGWNECRPHPESLKKSVIAPDQINLYRSSNHYANFIDCVKTRRDPAAPVEVGHRSATICHLGNIAMMLKRKLRWDPDNERFINDEQANRMLSKSMRAPWHL
ncbi:MAG: Gfo/Idh/MocA family protein [Planctomycetota bacterium]|jgi:predicted dehydrogenase